MKIIDAFTFYNELDMLLYRLSALDHVVDEFIIVEATKTHAGKDKPLFFEDNKQMFSRFLHKILHIVDDKLIVPDVAKGEQWYNEIHQRDAIDIGFTHLKLSPEDMVVISDLDEIPNPQVLEYIKYSNITVNYAALVMDFYYYNLNCKINEQWYHAKILNYSYFKKSRMTCNQARMGKSEQYFPKGGWHLSYFGDGEFIKNKLENFAHQEFNKEEYTNVDNINNCIDNYYNIFEQKKCDRYFKVPIAENDFLPPLYDTLLTKFIKC
jgi:beta-1,4-mannosyl-glycoprotein beta-1,4-N-acetylglucosaminyltransferase